MNIKKAILLSYIGGVLFLPAGSFDIPIIIYNKNMTIALGIILGEAIYGRKEKIKYNYFDYILVISCFISPSLSYLFNRSLGIYELIIVIINNYLTWGVAYITGRKYFKTEDDIKMLIHYSLVGIFIYTFLSLYEIRMSPQLSVKIYGFFAHDWIQHIRYGHFRPIVFMSHGLMVSFWIMVGSVFFFWEWRSKNMDSFLKIPVFLLFCLCFATLYLTRSKGALFLGIIGIIIWFAYKSGLIKNVFILLIAILPVYFFLRLQHFVSVDDIISLLSRFFDDSRIASFIYRFNAEEIIIRSIRGRELIGWGRWAFRVPFDYSRGRSIAVVDSLWIITYGAHGVLGLFCKFTLILSGPLSIIKNLKGKRKPCIESIMISLVLILFAYDCISNAMINVIYILYTGILVSYGYRLYSDKVPKKAI